jgi:hypothetical protein
MTQWFSKLTTNEYSLGIAILAFLVSIAAVIYQGHELSVHNAELETAKSALVTQGNELRAQQEALAVQQKQLENAERYFRAEGPVLTANLGFWRDAEPGERQDGTPQLLAEKNDQGNGGWSKAITLHRSDFEDQPKFYLELTVTNVGRSTGVISTVAGVSDLRVDAGCLGEYEGRGNSLKWCGDFDYNFSNGEAVTCLNTEGLQDLCSFPLSVPDGDSRKLRYDMTHLLSEPRFVCDKPGLVSLTVPKAGEDQRDLYIGMELTNNRHCPTGPGVVIPRQK